MPTIGPSYNGIFSRTAFLQTRLIMHVLALWNYFFLLPDFVPIWFQYLKLSQCHWLYWIKLKRRSYNISWKYHASLFLQYTNIYPVLLCFVLLFYVPIVLYYVYWLFNTSKGPEIFCFLCWKGTGHYVASMISIDNIPIETMPLPFWLDKLIELSYMIPWINCSQCTDWAHYG